MSWREIQVHICSFQMMGLTDKLVFARRHRQHVEADAYMESGIHTPEGYVHFTFDDKEWCNLSNKDEPIIQGHFLAV